MNSSANSKAESYRSFMPRRKSFQQISVIVPESPFIDPELQKAQLCLAALDVEKLMDWWPGHPHTPHRDPKKVRAIQRSLDWKRVAQIAAYLLQSEIVDVPERLHKCFQKIYEPTAMEPGREWPPRVSRIIGFEHSEYPIFSNVLLHVNGAEVKLLRGGAAKLVFDESNPDLYFSVIDGQHRVNGAYFALTLLREKNSAAKWEIPCEIFIDLDPKGAPPRRQAQIFIDVNFYQKKVDRSLVADLFPTARGRGPLDNKERAQDIGRRLMLEVGPLVGMIQIPGIRFGVRDVVTLATLNSAIENALEPITNAKIESLDGQTEFLARSLDAWLEATGRKEEITSDGLDPSNVAYQGRVLVSFLTLLPACIWKLRKLRTPLLSDKAQRALTSWLRGIMRRAGLLENGKFIAKSDFREMGFLGSGGIAQFRDTLWAAAIGKADISNLNSEEREKLAIKHRHKVHSELAPQ